MNLTGFEHLHVTEEDAGRTLLLELDHGKANEMGREQLGELEQLTRQLARGEATALISFSRRTSRRGTPIFVAGANVTERGDWTVDAIKTHVAWQRRVLAGLRAAPVLHVAVVSGVALGWGTEFMLTADYRVACDGAQFGLPETGLGILPGAGGTGELWSHIGVAQTLRLGMTGERIGPDEAVRIGLAQERVGALDDGLARARALARLAATRSPTAVAAFKRAVLASVGAPESTRTRLESRAYNHCVDTGEAAIGREHFAAVRAGERPPWGPRTRPTDNGAE